MAAVATLLAVLMALSTGWLVNLPQILQGLARPVDVVLIVSLGYAPLTGYMLSDQALVWESRARLRLLAIDLILLAAVIGPVALVGILAATAGHSDSLVKLVRDGCLMVGLTLGFSGVTSARNSATVPVLYFLVVTAVGIRDTGTPYWWAWVRADADKSTVAPSVAVLLIGFGLFRWRARRHASTVSDLELSDIR